jgi:4-hydroxythreonine-4-phosphate dehydrogenase
MPTPAEPRPLWVTPGDPRGIGPEVTARALAARPPARRHALVVGAAAPFEAAAAAAGLPTRRVEGPEAVAPGEIGVLDPGDAAEPVEIAALRAGVAACRARTARALVTGPIHKARLAARGFPYAGHTDFLGALCGVERPVMAFVGGRARVVLVTVHLPLRAVPDALSEPLLLHVLRAADDALRRQLRTPTQRLAVCGLNPHAGDAGLLGSEERDLIGPAVARARAEGLDALGPWSAEHAFVAHLRGEADMVVAMYHDQGLAPLKALDFGRSVNWTLGLPIVRTSVDHGTADDLVGTGRADPSSMGAALDLADQLTG